MGMVAIFFNGAVTLNKLSISHSKEGPKWNLVKISQAVSDKAVKDYMILYMYIAHVQEQITWEGRLIITEYIVLHVLP